MYEIDELRNKLDEAICGDCIIIDDNDEPYISVYSVLRMLDEVAAQASERDRGLQKYMITKEDGACTVCGKTEVKASVDLVVDGESTVSISNVKADLTWTYHQGYRHFKVIPFYNLDDSQLYNHAAIYEKYKQIINPNNDSRIQVGF